MLFSLSGGRHGVISLGAFKGESCSLRHPNTDIFEMKEVNQENRKDNHRGES
jgi:hypothetical protein